MHDEEVLKKLREMRNDALGTLNTYKNSLANLQADYDAGDNKDDTKAAIATSKRRIEKYTAEAEALSLAISNYGTGRTETEFSGAVKEAKLALTEVIRDGSDVTLKFFNHDDQMLLKLKDSAVNIQRFATQVLVQTNYAFEDVQHRLDGLDK